MRYFFTLRGFKKGALLSFIRTLKVGCVQSNHLLLLLKKESFMSDFALFHDNLCWQWWSPQPTCPPPGRSPPHRRTTESEAPDPKGSVSPPTRFPPRDFHGQNPPKPIRLDDIADQDETLTNDRNIPMCFPPGRPPTMRMAHDVAVFYHQSDHKVNGNRLLAAWP